LGSYQWTSAANVTARLEEYLNHLLFIKSVSKPPMRTAGADGRIGQGMNPAPDLDDLAGLGLEHQI